MMFFKNYFINNKSKNNFSVRNFFGMRNFILLPSIYFLSILTIIFLEFDFSKDFWHHYYKGKLSSNRIAIYSIADRAAEGMLYNRLGKVMQDEQMDYYGVLFKESLINFFITKHLYTQATNLINYLFKPSFNLSLTPYVNILPIGVNITYLNKPTSTLYDVYGNFKNEFSHLKDYNIYADLYSLVHENNPTLEKLINNDQKIIPLYIAQNYVPYLPASIDKAILTGSLWGCNRESLRSLKALKKLADDDLLVAYGLKNYLSFLGRAYEGSFESIDGDMTQSIISIQREYGIALIIHNLEHMLEGIPTSRISEAAAAGALIISDNNYFIQKYFGNNVLYFDALGDENKIYSQIKAHINWAKENPEEATAKAKASHQIFFDNFTIEKQLKFLIKQISND